MPSGRRRRPSMTEASPRSRSAARVGGEPGDRGSQEVEQVGVAACLRDVVRRPAVAGGQRPERAALEQAGDDRCRRAVPGGLVQRREPRVAAEAPLVDRDPAELEHLEHLGPATGLGGVGEAVVAGDDLLLQQSGVEDAGPRGHQPDVQVLTSGSMPRSATRSTRPASPPRPLRVEPSQPLRSWPSKTRSPSSVSTASTCSPSRDQRRRRQHPSG